MWTPKGFIDETIEKVKDEIKDEKAVIALSGGVDSSVTALFFHWASRIMP